MKQILSPTPSKIILTFVLLIISSLLWRMYIVATLSDTFPVGFPLQFILAWGPCQPNQNCSDFNGVYLVGDILFWYGVSAGIMGWAKRKSNLLKKGG